MILTVFRSLLVTLVLGVPLLHASEQESELLLAVDRGNLVIVKQLLSHGVNPSCALITSIRYRHGEYSFNSHRYAIIQELLAHGANPNMQDNEGNTALIIASDMSKISPEYLEVVKLLLHYKANPNIQNNEGNTALLRAVYRSDRYNCDVVKLLLEHGANPHIKNNKRKTAIDYVTYTYRSPVKHKISSFGGNVVGATASLFACGVPLWGFGDDMHRKSTNSEAIKNKRTILKLLKKRGVKLTRWQQFTWKV
ncbi:MAG: ankyrin repeat domain-containing protein [Candidatus Babeliales bacterium]